MRTLKIAIVVFSAVVLTTFAIDASDTFRGRSGTMVANLIGSNDSSGCPQGMVLIETAQSFSCVDVYEASAAGDCPFQIVDSELGTIANIADSDCAVVSEPQLAPWSFVSREQAALLCTRAGKRLPTASEWYQAAIGTPDDKRCNTDSRRTAMTGSYDSCKSATGIVDAVGNVWEWTSDDVFDGNYGGRDLPEGGYVSQVANDGVPTMTAQEPGNEFGQDYLWSSETGAYGVIRGGFYGSGSDGGVFALHAETLPTSNGAAIGFRCVR